MSRPMLVLFLILFTTSCSSSKKCYRHSKTILSCHWNDKIFLVDNYFKIKEGNYFQYYQKVFPPSILRSVEYRGSYSKLNDTLFLKFCGDTIPQLLPDRILIDTSKNTITMIRRDSKRNYVYNIDYSK